MRGIVVFAIILLLVSGLLAGYALGHKQDAYSPMNLARANALAQETTRKATEAPVWLIVRVTLVLGAGGMGLYLLYRVFERRARVIYADANGIMPAIVLRAGETVVDLGGLAGPLQLGTGGPQYSLPAGAVPALQEGANRGAATTRSVRAYASGAPAARRSPALAPLPTPGLDLYPPLEVLPGGEAAEAELLQALEEEAR